MSDTKPTTTLSNAGKRKKRDGLNTKPAKKILKFEKMIEKPADKNEELGEINPPMNVIEESHVESSLEREVSVEINPTNNDYEKNDVLPLSSLIPPDLNPATEDDVSQPSSLKPDLKPSPENVVFPLSSLIPPDLNPATEDDVSPSSSLKRDMKPSTKRVLFPFSSLIPPDMNDDEIVDDDTLNKNYEEFYLGNDYCLRNDSSEQYYAKNSYGQELYRTDANGEKIYAYKKIEVNGKEQLVQYPIIRNDGSPDYIYVQGIPKYPENLVTAEIIFPIDPITKEEMYLMKLNGDKVYPKNQFGREFYRKDSNGKEIAISYHKYAKNSEGTEIYPKMPNGDEYYLRDKININSEKGAIQVLEDGLQKLYYARKANGDEFYPRAWISKNKHLEDDVKDFVI